MARQPIAYSRARWSHWVSPIPTGVAEQHGVRGVFFIVRGNRGQLDQISALVDEGKLKPVIAEVLPLARAREAFELGAEIHSPGKIVLQARAA
jgi:NADPH:quinone reductase-like Zn-dependent oxidoreductase